MNRSQNTGQLTLLRPPFVLLAEPLQRPNVGFKDRLVLPTTPKTPNFGVEECQNILGEKQSCTPCYNIVVLNNKFSGQCKVQSKHLPIIGRHPADKLLQQLQHQVAAESRIGGLFNPQSMHFHCYCKAGQFHQHEGHCSPNMHMISSYTNLERHHL